MHRSWWRYGTAVHGTPVHGTPVHRRALRVVMQAAVLICVWGLAIGCGEDGPGFESEVSDPTDNSTDTVADAEDLPDVQPDAGGADAADGVDRPVTCESGHENLGRLSTGEPTVVSRTLDGLQGEPMSCAPSGEGRGEYIFEFEVGQLAILETSVSAATTDPLAFGLFADGCGSDTESYCTGQSLWRAIVEPETTYFLKVQAGADTINNTFNASFSLEDAACVPGEATCSESTSNHCVQGTSVETYACAQGCTDTESCAGDTCQTALTVEPIVGGDAVSIQGDRRAYTHQWNAADSSDCEVSGAIETGETTDMEVFVRVPNLEAGQILDVSHPSDGGSYLYFVLDDCAATSCREAVFVDDTTAENRLVWQVPEGGDYTVVIEALSNTSRPFQFDFALR